MNSKEKKIAEFNPSGIGDKELNIYGLPFTAEESDTILIPVPWEATVSYGGGTAGGPAAIFEASYQVDLLDSDVNDGWKKGIFMEENSEEIVERNNKARNAAEEIISALEDGKEVACDEHLSRLLEVVNYECSELKNIVRAKTAAWLDQKKSVGIVGGDHSTPLGFFETLAERNESFSILQIDAHCDLRKAYEGFTYSHASIMYNALKIPQVKKLVQVGIRDYCEEEIAVAKHENGRVEIFFDAKLKREQYTGITWKQQCEKIISTLTEKVYISFDIDGLDPRYCPNTGTPVPGGLETEQTFLLFKMLVDEGKKIIGFDLNEVSPSENEWDANVGARVLYKLCNLARASRG